MDVLVDEGSLIASLPAAADARSIPIDTGNKFTVGTLNYTRNSLVPLFGWLLWGDLVWQIKDRSIGPVFQLLLKQFHASDLLASVLLVTVPQIIGIAIGPYISTASDRHRGRWGRRVPFLLIPTPFASLSIIALGFAPLMGRWLNALTGGGQAGIDRCILLFFAMFWLMFDISTTVANAVFNAFVNDFVPANALGRFFGAFRAVSLLAGIAFNFWLLGKTGAHYLPICIGVGLLYGIGVPLMCLKVKEGKYPPPRRLMRCTDRR